MMTIRHVTNIGESLFEATSINLDKCSGSTSSQSRIGTLYAHLGDGQITIDGGIAYVMNGNGKTVAVYDFTDNSRAPLQVA